MEEGPLLTRIKAFEFRKRNRDKDFQDGGRSSLLLRLFESEWFNEQMALQYLYQSPSPAVEDYLCNKLLGMREASIERYLLQFVYLAVSRPGSALERTLELMCSKSFSIALKVHWLLLALCQDQNRPRQVELLKERCEKASLDGHWEVPFPVTHLEPLSPAGPLSRQHSEVQPMSPVLSPITQAPINLIMGASPSAENSSAMAMLAPAGLLTKIDESQEFGRYGSMLSDTVEQHEKEQAHSRQASLQQQHQQLPGEHTQLEETQGAIPVPAPSGLRVRTDSASLNSRGHGSARSLGTSGQRLQEHMQRLHAELGDGEGVTALVHRSVGGAVAVAHDDEGVLSDDDVAGGVPGGGHPLSPLTRIRHDTFNATVEFMETLCDASSCLAAISQEERQRVLRHSLEAINRQLDRTVQRDVAVWYPLSRTHERVVRIIAKEAVLLNSREKAPFMLFVEVLQNDDCSPPPLPSTTPYSPALPLPAPYPAPQLGRQTLPGTALDSLKGTLASIIGRQIASPQTTSPPASTVALSNETPNPTPTPASPAKQYSERDGFTGGTSTPMQELSPLSKTAAAAGSSPGGQSGQSTGISVAYDVDASAMCCDSPDGRASQVPSTATSSGLPCSIATSTSIGTRGSAFTSHMHAAMAVTACAAAPASPGGAGLLAGGSSGIRADVQSIPSQGPIAAALEALGTVFKSLEPAAAVVATTPAMHGDASAASLIVGGASEDAGGMATQLSVGSMQSAQDGTLMSSVSVVSSSSAPQASVVIPHRRRQTSDPEALLVVQRSGLPQQHSGTGVVHSLLSSTGIESAAEVAAASQAAGSPRSVTETQLTTISRRSDASFDDHMSEEGGAASSAAPSFVNRSLHPEPSIRSGVVAVAGGAPQQPIVLMPPTGNQVDQHPLGEGSIGSSNQAAQGEVSLWASALNSLTRVLLPSSTTSPPVTSGGFSLPFPTTSRPSSPPSQQPAAPATESVAISHDSAQPLIAAAGAAGMVDGTKHPGPLTAQDMVDLIKDGVLPAPAQPSKQGPTSSLGARIADAAAGLRGEAPLVRLKLSILPAAHQAEAAAQAAQDHMSSYPSSSTHSGAGAEPGSLVGSGAASLLLASGSNKALTLLSKMGLCARPSIDEDADQALPSPPGLLRRISIEKHKVAQALAGPKFVAVSLEVAGGVNLAIVSPYRKSRRTPSHEAISMVANELKIYEMPPPLEIGPPLPTADATGPTTGRQDPERVDASQTGLPKPSLSNTATSAPEPVAAAGMSLRADVAPATASAASAPPAAAGTGATNSSAAVWSLPASASFHSQASTQSLSFPQTRSHADSTSSPTIMAAQARDSKAAETISKVGGLPMVGGVVSAAAAAAPGALSPNLDTSSVPAAPAPSTSSKLTSAILPSILSLSAPIAKATGQQSSVAGSSAAPQVIPGLTPSKAVLPPSQSEPGFGTQLPHDAAAVPLVQHASLADTSAIPAGPTGGITIPALNSHSRQPSQSQEGPQMPSKGGAASIMPSILSLARVSQPADSGASQRPGPTTPQLLQTLSPATPAGPSSSGGGSKGSVTSPATSAVTSAAARFADAVTSRAKALVAHLPKLDTDGQNPPKAIEGSSSSGLAPRPATVSSTGSATPSPFASHQPASLSGSGTMTASNMLSPPAITTALSTCNLLGEPPACSLKLDAATEQKRREAWAVYGERWACKVKRLQRESPHGRRKGWALRCVIVKSGDDCRQEQLAVQLIRTFAEIFSQESLPLWVRPYEVLVTSNKTALIEVVPDSYSIHTVKHRSPPGWSLSDHFFAKWPRGTPECMAAQRKFTESLAAYSIICYLLQIKDRHNGNILIDDEGHLVHIDFGFMLSNSPGNLQFEAAPFKLTRELLEVMDSNSEGKPSELFDYYKVLMIQGFLACRKHHDRLLLLIRVMSKSGLPCFKTGERAVKTLEKRLSLQLTEMQMMQEVLSLISDSLDAWRTRQYDYYQRLCNGIL